MKTTKTTNPTTKHRPTPKRRLVILLIVLLLGIPCLSYGQGMIRLSTYFPAPFGIFNQLRIVPGPNPASCAGRDGLLWVNAAGELKVCMGGFAVVPSGIWEQNRTTNKVYLTDVSTAANPDLKVGIGTAPATAAAARLHVLSTTATPLRLDSDTLVPNVGMDIWAGGSKRGGMISSSTHALSIQNGASAGMFDVSQAGFVGIGASVLPSYSINAIGDMTAQAGQFMAGVADTTAAFMVLYGSAVDEGGQIDLDMAADYDGVGAERWFVDSFTDDLRIYREGSAAASLYLDQAGNGAFGGVPIAGNKSTVRGDMRISNGVSGTITYGAMYYISDKATKDHIRPLKGEGLSIISQLNGVRYRIKGTGQESIGLVAQDVEKVLPELVGTTSGDNIKGVQYANIIAPLIEAIKEQQAQIKQLRKELESLKENRF